MAAFLGLGLPLGGCALPAADEPHVANRVPVYNTHTGGEGSVRVILPDGFTVPAVTAAARDELEWRGYTILEHESTLDRGLVVAAPPDARLGDRVVVGSQILPFGADLSVRMAPRRNSVVAEDVLIRILTRLGL